MTFFRPVLAALAAIVATATTAVAGPPCSSERGVAICLEWIRPYSDNAYLWGKTISIEEAPPSDPNVLCGDNGEFWDFIDGW